MKAIFVLLSMTVVSFITSSAQADYMDGATVQCTGNIVHDGVQFPVNSSKAYSYDELAIGNARVFLDSAVDMEADPTFHVFVSGFILPTGPGYDFRGESVTMSLDLNTTAITGSQTQPTYRIAQKFSDAPGNTFSMNGSWSSEDHKDSFDSHGELFKYDYNVTCTVLTNGFPK